MSTEGLMFVLFFAFTDLEIFFVINYPKWFANLNETKILLHKMDRSKGRATNGSISFIKKRFNTSALYNTFSGVKCLVNNHKKTKTR